MILTVACFAAQAPQSFAEETFSVNDFEFYADSVAQISFTKELSKDCIDKVSVFGGSGENLTDKADISIEKDTLKISFDNIYESMKYFIKLSDGFCGADGESLSKSKTFLLETDGKFYDFNGGAETDPSWQRTSLADPHNTAWIYNDRLFIANSSPKSEKFLYDGIAYTENAVLVNSEDYCGSDFGGKSMLEYEMTVNTAGSLGDNYDGLSTVFGAGEFQTTVKKNDYSNAAFSSKTGGYVLRVYSNAKKAELRKWTGNEIKIGAENANGKYTMGEVIAGAVTNPQKPGAAYKYRIETQNADNAVKISVKRAAPGEDGRFGVWEEILSCTDSDNPISGDGYYFMTGSTWRNGKVGYINSFCIDNLAYTSGEWNFSEYTEPVLEPEVSIIGSDIKISFNEPVAKEEVDKYVKIYRGEYANEIKTDAVLDGSRKTAVISFGTLAPQTDYYISIGKDLKSVMGYSMTDAYIASFKTDGFYSEQDGTSPTDSAWKIYSGDVRGIDAYLNNGMIFVGKNKPGAELFEDTVYSQGGLLQKADYADYSLKDASLEFDYMSRNTSSVTANPEWGGFRVFFNADEYVNEMGNWDTNISAKKGAYIMTVASDKNKIVLGLRKWHGNKQEFSQRTTLSSFGEVLVQNTSFAVPITEKVRFRISAKNTDNGEEIKVLGAKYTDGVLGGFSEIMSYCDKTDPYTEGTFYFTACGSNAAYTNGYISSHHVGNISYIAAADETAEKAADVYEREYEKIAEFAEGNGISADKYSDLKKYLTISAILSKNGFDCKEQTEKLQAMRDKIPYVSGAEYENTNKTHKITLKLSQSIKDTENVLKMTCDGEEFCDYKVLNDKNDIIVEFYNDREYDSIYTMTLSSRAVGENGMQIMEGYSYTLREEPILSCTEIAAEKTDGKVTAKAEIRNSAAEDTACYAVLAAYSVLDGECEKLSGVAVKDTKISAKSGTELTLETADENTEFRLYIYDSKNTLVQCYKTVTAK